MKLRLLAADDVGRSLPMAAAIEAMKEAFAALSAGRAVLPQRAALDVREAGGTTLVMPGYLPGEGLATKLVSVFPGNAERGLPVISGLVAVLDPETGRPAALIEGAALTALRTGAAGGAATDLLARADARVGALFGTGPQAATQLLALCAVRELEEVRIHARTAASVERFADAMAGRVSARLVAAPSAAAAIDGADVVTAATSSQTPVFDGAGLAAGAHVNGVGSFTLAMREIDSATIARARVFVDQVEAATEEAGELMAAEREGVTRREDWIELGRVVAEPALGRRGADEVTFFKSVGVAVQDVVAAARVLEAAAELGLGTIVEL